MCQRLRGKSGAIQCRLWCASAVWSYALLCSFLARRPSWHFISAIFTVSHINNCTLLVFDMLLELLVSKGKPMSGHLVFLLSYEAGFALAHRVLGELDILLFVPLYGYIHMLDLEAIPQMAFISGLHSLSCCSKSFVQLTGAISAEGLIRWGNAVESSFLHEG